LKISRACFFSPVRLVVLVLLLLPFQLDAQQEETVVTALAIAPNGRTFYAGTGHGEVFKTFNTGRRWSLTGPGVQGAVRDLEIDPALPTTVFAATDQGLFVTADGGASWRNALPEAIAVAAAPGVVYAGLEGPVPLVRSNDHGLTWTPAWSGLEGRVQALTVHPAQSNVVFAATSTGVFRSETSGRTWARAGLDDSDVTRLVFEPLPPHRLYATRIAQPPPGPFGDLIWTEVYLTHSSRVFWRRTGIFGGPALVDLAADTRLPGTVYAGFVALSPTLQPRGLWKSTNVLGQWQHVLEGSQVHSLATNPRHPGLLLAGFYSDHPDPGVIAMTRDGGLTWTSIGFGIMEGTLQ